MRTTSAEQWWSLLMTISVEHDGAFACSRDPDITARLRSTARCVKPRTMAMTKSTRSASSTYRACGIQNKSASAGTRNNHDGRRAGPRQPAAGELSASLDALLDEPPGLQQLVCSSVNHSTMQRATKKEAMSGSVSDGIRGTATPCAAGSCAESPPRPRRAGTGAAPAPPVSARNRTSSTTASRNMKMHGIPHERRGVWEWEVLV